MGGKAPCEQLLDMGEPSLSIRVWFGIAFATAGNGVKILQHEHGCCMVTLQYVYANPGPYRALSFLRNHCPPLESDCLGEGCVDESITLLTEVCGEPVVFKHTQMYGFVLVCLVPTTAAGPQGQYPLVFEQCRQGKSATWIRNLGNRTGSEGWAWGPISIFGSCVVATGLLCARRGNVRGAVCLVWRARVCCSGVLSSWL